MKNKNACHICVLLLVFVLTFSGCTSKSTVAKKHIFSQPKEYPEYTKETICSNDEYSLLWDSQTGCVSLLSNTDGKICSSIPYEFYTSGIDEGLGYVRMTSPINIEYYDEKSRSINTSYGSIDVINDGHMTSEKVGEGLKVTYYFDQLNISIPVLYSLGKDCVKTTLLINEIGEGNKKVYSVTVTPFYCSTKSGDNSWLFVPSGSGALMYADQGKRAERTASVRMFGDELSETITESILSQEKAYLPVFGAGNESEAVMGLISEGNEFVRLDAQAGNEEIGYSAISPTFLLRNIDMLKVSQMYSGYKALVRKATDSMVEARSATVCFYPLSGEKANYNGIADKYRTILFKNAKCDADYKQLYINFLGGANISKNFLGVNYKTLKSTTSFSDADEILNEIYKKTKISQVVTMVGYGKSGLDIGKLAGGFDLASTFGSQKELKKLNDSCRKNKSLLAIDFDIFRFSSSGCGVSTFTDCTTTANGTTAKQYFFSRANHLPKNLNEYYYLLARGKFDDIEEKLLNTLNIKGYSSVSLSDLGSLTYSDCSDVDFIGKNGFSKSITDFLKRLKKDKKNIMLSSPNSYAAVFTDYITSSPMKSSLNDAFDEDVPFYQMVMHGYVPMAVSSVNLSADAKDAFLYAIETGSSLSYTLSANWQDGFEDTSHSELKYTTYDFWKNTIFEDVDKASEYLEAVSSSTITYHSIISDGVTKTVFSNGVSVYVNRSNKTVSTPVGKITANGFKYSK